MPTLKIAEQTIELPRKLGLLDTNVLVALADKADQFHNDASIVIEECDYELAISYPVIVEACGLLSSRRGHRSVLNLLELLLQPGSFWLLPGCHPVLETQRMLVANVTWMQKFSIDYVDAHLMDLASVVTDQFDLKPHLPIFTFDTKDFMRCAAGEQRYSLFDMKSLELIDFAA
jgi:predicted nucleic acid-binding protein